MVLKSVLWRFTLFCQEFFVAIYALLCGEKLCQKLCVWRKKDKYQVCARGQIQYSAEKYDIDYTTSHNSIMKAMQSKATHFPENLVEIGLSEQPSLLHCIHKQEATVGDSSLSLSKPLSPASRANTSHEKNSQPVTSRDLSFVQKYMMINAYSGKFVKNK